MCEALSGYCTGPEIIRVPRALIPGQLGARPWTPEEENELRAFAVAKTHRKVVAKHLGRTQGAVEARMARLGLLIPRTRRAPG